VRVVDTRTTRSLWLTEIDGMVEGHPGRNTDRNVSIGAPEPVEPVATAGPAVAHFERSVDAVCQLTG
jgi:hypothetical protein